MTDHPVHQPIEGAHSEWAYKQLEAAVDGVVDFRLDEQVEEARDIMRVRSIWNVGFDHDGML